MINPDGDVLAYAYEEYEIINRKPEWSEHDPHRYWEIACELIQRCLSESGVDPAEIACIGTSSALPSLVMVDKEGEPLLQAYNLMDRRATEQVQWLRDNIGSERIFDVSANRLNDHPVIVNLMWERDHHPDTYREMDSALTIDGFLRRKLTGRSTVNYSAGSFYGVAYDIRERAFDDDLLEEIDVNPDILPEPYPCESLVGEVSREAAAETGLQPGTPVSAGQVDCNAAWLGGGAVQSGDIQMNLGTCGVFGIVHEAPEFLNTMIACPYTVDSSEKYITIACTTTGGQLLRYTRDNFSPLEREMEERLDIDVYDLLNLQAKDVELGSGGLIVLPYLQGERTPLWDVDARGVVFGLSLSHGKKHLVRAMMESVAYALYDSFRLIREEDISLNLPLIMNEGGAVSRLWRRIITDVFNVPTAMVKNRVGAPYGDAILAGVSAELFDDFSVAQEWAEYIDPMEPNPDNHETYMEFFDLYQDLYQHLKDDFKRLTELRSRS